MIRLYISQFKIDATLGRGLIVRPLELLSKRVFCDWQQVRRRLNKDGQRKTGTHKQMFNSKTILQHCAIFWIKKQRIMCHLRLVVYSKFSMGINRLQNGN